MRSGQNSTGNMQIPTQLKLQKVRQELENVLKCSLDLHRSSLYQQAVVWLSGHTNEAAMSRKESCSKNWTRKLGSSNALTHSFTLIHTSAHVNLMTLLWESHDTELHNQSSGLNNQLTTWSLWGIILDYFKSLCCLLYRFKAVKLKIGVRWSWDQIRHNKESDINH